VVAAVNHLRSWSSPASRCPPSSANGVTDRRDKRSHPPPGARPRHFAFVRTRKSPRIETRSRPKPIEHVPSERMTFRKRRMVEIVCRIATHPAHGPPMIRSKASRTRAGCVQSSAAAGPPQPTRIFPELLQPYDFMSQFLAISFWPCGFLFPNRAAHAISHCTGRLRNTQFRK
jgi:hypothetical protein